MKKQVISVSPRQLNIIIENLQKGDKKVFQIGLPVGELLEIDLEASSIVMRTTKDHEAENKILAAICHHNEVVEILEEINLNPEDVKSYNNAFKALGLGE